MCVCTYITILISRAIALLKTQNCHLIFIFDE